MDELVDSTRLRGHERELRAGIRRDGYVWLRDFVDVCAIEAARAAIARVLVDAGLTEVSGRYTGPISEPGDPPHPALRRAAAEASFNRLPYLESLRELVSAILGDNAYALPSKVLRATPPAAFKTEPGRFAHQDFSYWGVNDMVTTWVPLMDIPVGLGGLALIPGSQRGGQVPLETPPANGGGWATADFAAGDVVAFHCLTAHAALPNQTRRVRLSGDFRWLRLREAVSSELVVGRRGSGAELFSREFGEEPWWRPMPPDAVIVPGRPTPPGASCLVDVDPSWQSWSEPIGGLSGG